MHNCNNCGREEELFRPGGRCVGRLRSTVPTVALTSAKHGLKLKSLFFGSNLYKYGQVEGEDLQLHL